VLPLPVLLKHTRYCKRKKQFKQKFKIKIVSHTIFNSREMHNRYVHFFSSVKSMRLCKPTVWIILKNVFFEKNYSELKEHIYIFIWESVYTPWNCVYVRMNQPVLLLYFEYRFSIRDDSVYGTLYNSPCTILSHVYWWTFTVYLFWERETNKH